MHVTAARVNTGDQPIETAKIVAEEMHRWLRELDGYEGFLMLSRPGTTLGLTFWADADVAERHSAARGQFRERMSGVVDVEIVEVVDYELMFGELGPLHGG